MITDTPHRMIDSVAGSITNGAQGMVGSLASTIRGAGGTLMRELDKPFTSITGKEGPHRVIGRLADGAVDTAAYFVNTGLIGTVQKGAESIMRALDQPVEQIGFPPKFPKMRK